MILKRKYLNIIGTYILLIICVNLLFWSLIGFNFGGLSQKGFIFKIRPIDYAMVFAHGYVSGTCYNNTNTSCHITTLDNKYIPTKELIDNLAYEGYNKIWLSQCHTGDYSWMVKYANKTEIKWYDFVSRNKNPGKTIPIFTGINIIRISSQKI